MFAALAVCSAQEPSRESSRVAFQESADAFGLAYRHHSGASGRYYQPETDGSGVAVFDYDGDGDPDVLFRGGGRFPGYEGPEPATRLFRNEGRGRFVDVTEAAGIVSRALFDMGATAGDYDADGDLDLYLTGVGANQLYQNQGDGTFTDVTAASGTAEPRWSSSAAFADPDGDGDLDLYVANYLDFDLEERPDCSDPKSGRRGYCHPDLFAAVSDRFFLNQGDGTYSDATESAGFITATPENGSDPFTAPGKGLGVLFTDVDDDRWPDLYLANDTTPNHLFVNLGMGRFEDRSLLSGASLGPESQSEAGMGIAAGDYDRDGRIDLYVTNYSLETNALYKNVGFGTFVDLRHPAGLSGPTIRSLGFGTAFADFDHDGHLELVVANGHVLDNVEQIREHITYRQKNQLFIPTGNGRFEECTTCGLDVVRVSRGLAQGDLDGDGDLDLVISNSNDVAEVYENVSEKAGSWLSVAIVSASANRNAIGARVTVQVAETGGGTPLVREVATGTSYLSQSQLPVHFGLDEPAQRGTVEILAPRGLGTSPTRVRLPLVPGRRYEVHL